MKRLLSLAMCLVMVLGLFTGVVGAETIATLVIQDDFGTVIGPNSNPTLQTGLFSQFGFNAYKDSVDEANSIGNLTLVDSEGNPTDQLGVLKPGAAADIIVMDYKPFTPFSDANIDGHMIFGMTGRQCETTMCNGKLLMKDRQLIGIDEEAINAKTMEAAKTLWGRLNK